MNKHIKLILLQLLVSGLIISGCSAVTPNNSSTTTPPDTSSTTSTSGATTQSTDSNSTNTETPVAAEKNPPGDIPDSQVFVNYASTNGGYELQVPEGWARTENGSNVMFTDKYDGVKVEVTDVTYGLSADNIKTNYVPTLKSNVRAITIDSTAEVQTKNLTAVKVAYSSNSEPDPVTDKQIRLENECYFFIKDGEMAVMTLWAPYGADNVDQWKLMSDSFKWSK